MAHCPRTDIEPRPAPAVPAGVTPTDGKAATAFIHGGTGLAAAHSWRPHAPVRPSTGACERVQ